MFFDPNRKNDFASRNVREELVKIRREVLKYCKILVSKNYIDLEGFRTKLGSTCLKGSTYDLSVTHVLAKYGTGKDCLWGLQNGKFVVNLQWLIACYNAN